MTVYDYCSSNALKKKQLNSRLGILAERTWLSPRVLQISVGQLMSRAESECGSCTCVLPR